MKRILFISVLVMLSVCAVAQRREKDEDEKEEKTKFKENLFTGGSISLGLSNNYFQVGGNPVFGYSITNWTDLGLVFNYTYNSYRDYNYSDDRLRQTVYGGGAFVKVYPVRFLFAQAQLEHNFITQRYVYPRGSGFPDEKVTFDANSVLIGGGYCTGREGRGGGPSFYLAVLFDVSSNDITPYKDNLGRAVPIVRGGVQIPLFQGGKTYSGRGGRYR